jgi:hypothetical protein
MSEPEKEEGWVEHPAFAGKPQKTPQPNTTFAERAAARQPKKKAVQAAENKAVAADKPARKGK